MNIDALRERVIGATVDALTSPDQHATVTLTTAEADALLGQFSELEATCDTLRRRNENLSRSYRVADNALRRYVTTFARLGPASRDAVGLLEHFAAVAAHPSMHARHGRGCVPAAREVAARLTHELDAVGGGAS